MSTTLMLWGLAALALGLSFSFMPELLHIGAVISGVLPK
jgi:hypothetical protein